MKFNDHVLNCNFGAFIIVQMGTFGADAKYTNAQKLQFRSESKT